MNAKLLLDDLRGRGVKIETDGERLLVDAPAGVITEDLRDALIKNKTGLLKLLERERRRLEEASMRGLIIRWSEYPTWIKLHDPLTGEWHEVRASECLPGIIRTANRYYRRKDDTA
ncbi:hypothetical protein Rxyl_1597 [Rubrobacter xylanophilus DSM 9941]|uniref:TubC N-terminal docking domain-containing protein n=1 Tax=Rubrobacter xylanophilus (strain DSM 9941 / JCM 11954 / NBRC 16129 / PRD-1) TaxID=266117 RepID=Q1AVL9_RUBXD|nr:hypothetical protein [Rubrobacter xylanophilus]ABG04559.1 hypothetical protein Rxyl_1597 [Rubrobacter xylanophilus DSM 9941]